MTVNYLDSAFIEDKLIHLEWRPIERKQFKIRCHQRETKWNMRRLRKGARYTFQGKSRHWRGSSNQKGKQSKKGKSKKGNTPRIIVCRILNYKDKVKILRNVKKQKDKNIFINENFSQATLDHRKELWKEVKPEREEGKIAYLQHRSTEVKKKDNTG